jgi:tetratricopeptide (TPR) repeat protein
MLAVAAVALFCSSLAISGLVRSCYPDVDDAEHALPDLPKVSGERLPRVVSPKERPQESEAERLERADRHLRNWDLSAALKIYRQLLSEAQGAHSGPLHFRMAVCHEGLGNWNKSLAAYRQTINDVRILHLHAAAQCAQARIQIRLDRHAEAKQLLYPLVFTADATLVPAHAAADARYWLGLALSRAAIPITPLSMSPSTVVAPQYDPSDRASILSALRAPPKAHAPNQPDPPAGRVVIEVGQMGDETMVVRASFASTPALELFETIAKTAGLRADWTPQAKECIKDRQTRLVVEQWPLTQLFEALADSFGLVCQLEGEELRIATAVEASPEAVQAFQFDLARHALRAALSATPDHHLNPTVSLFLGNLEVAAGNPKEAMKWYDKILREKATSPVVVHANYNLGILHGRTGDCDAARKSFYRVLDLSPGHELAPPAHLHIGRMYLEENNLKSAVPTLRRACATSTGSPSQPLAALSLAAALLLGDEPRPARATLAQYRGQLKQDRHRTTATLLDSLARYRLARPKEAARVEAADLLAALAHEGEPGNLGPFDAYLRCLAYRELGLWSEVAATCEQALPQILGPLAPAMKLMLGDALLHGEKPADAVPVFKALSEGKAGKWTAEARFRLARFEFQEGRAQECIRMCAQLCQEQPCADVAAMFRLWGAAHDHLGEHDKAARCYAGEPPE